MVGRELAAARQAPIAAVWYMLGLLSLAIIVSYLDRGVVAVLVPYLKSDFALTDTQISLLQGFSFSLPFAIASLPVGRLVDRLNRRNIIIVGIMIWSACTMACGLVGSYPQLIAARAGVGIGEAFLLPAAYSMVADSFTTQRRGRAMSVLAVSTALGGGSSALFGGALLTIWSGTAMVSPPVIEPVATWRAVFLVAGVPGFLVVPLMLAVREPRRSAPPVQQPEAGSFMGYLTQNWRLFVPLYVAVAALFFYSYAVAIWTPTVLARTFAYPAGVAGMIAGTCQLVGSIAGGALSGWIGDILIARRTVYGRLRLLMIGLIPALLGAILIAMPSRDAFLIGLALAMFSSGLVVTVTYPALYDIVAPNMRGRSVALQLFLGNIVGLGGGTLGVALITQHVFSNEKLVNYSVGLAAAGSASVALVMVLVMRKRYESARLSTLRDSASL